MSVPAIEETENIGTERVRIVYIMLGVGIVRTTLHVYIS